MSTVIFNFTFLHFAGNLGLSHWSQNTIFHAVEMCRFLKSHSLFLGGLSAASDSACGCAVRTNDNTGCFL